MLSILVKVLGVWAAKKPVMKIMFGQKFLQDTNRAAERKQWEKELAPNRKTITRSVKGAIAPKRVEEEPEQVNRAVEEFLSKVAGRHGTKQ